MTDSYMEDSFPEFTVELLRAPFELVSRRATSHLLGALVGDNAGSNDVLSYV